MTATDAVSESSAARAAEAFADKIFTALLGTMETFSLYLGERLGWLAALAAGPLTPAELAAQTGTAERYAVEWLEMQAVYGNVVVTEDDAENPATRRYELPPAAAEVLTDEHSLSYLGALPRMFAAVGLHLRRAVGKLQRVAHPCPLTQRLRRHEAVAPAGGRTITDAAKDRDAPRHHAAQLAVGCLHHRKHLRAQGRPRHHDSAGPSPMVKHN